MTYFFKTEKTGKVHFRYKETSVQMTVDGNKPIVLLKHKVNVSVIAKKVAQSKVRVVGWGQITELENNFSSLYWVAY